MTAHEARKVQACMDCGKPYGDDWGLDAMLPNSQWADIVPGIAGVLCANCMVLRASKLPGVIAVRMVIEIAPPKDHPVLAALLEDNARLRRFYKAFEELYGLDGVGPNADEDEGDRLHGLALAEFDAAQSDVRLAALARSPRLPKQGESKPPAPRPGLA